MPQPAQVDAGSYRLDGFRDLGIPPGFVALAGEDHVATSLLGGELRVLHTTLIAHQEPDEAIDWAHHFNQHLPRQGWQQAKAPAGWWHPQRREILYIDTGRTAGRSIIRLTLAPAGPD